MRAFVVQMSDHRRPSSTADSREGAMAEIHVHEFMSLDGVIDAPTWTADFGFTPRMGELIGGVMGGATGLLLVRTTYEMFQPAWSTRTVEDDPGAPFFNESPKYVVTSTLVDPTWQNTTVVGSYDPATIRRLKDEVTGTLYTSGSATLVRAMLADGLVDELHLFVYPVTRGKGPRPFPAGQIQEQLALQTCEALDNGVAYLNYRIERQT
jgi:dihydrofolate reductase